MIPKVNRFYYFYYSSDFSNPDNRHSFIQLIAEANDFHTDGTITPERIALVTRNRELCQLLFQDEWDSRYGVVRYFRSFADYEQLKKHLTIISDLLASFGLTEIRKAIGKNLEFYFENSDQFKLLRELPESDPEWDRIIEALESRYNFHYAGPAINEIALRILANPAEFCVDENGNEIERDYTGKLKTHYASGNLRKEYSFVGGKLDGECMEFDFNGNKASMYWYNPKQKKKDRMREWHKNGQLKYEKTGDNFKYWFDNGQPELEVENEVRKRWDRSGNQIE